MTVGADGDLAVWDPGNGDRLAVIPFSGELYGVAAHRTEPLVAAVGHGGLVHLAEIVNLPVPW